MKVHLPSPLYSYSDGQAVVEGRGQTVRQVVQSLDRTYPGLAFRIVDEMGQLRRHIRIFVDGQADDDLERAVEPQSEIHIVAALSGG